MGLENMVVGLGAKGVIGGMLLIGGAFTGAGVMCMM